MVLVVVIVVVATIVGVVGGGVVAVAVGVRASCSFPPSHQPSWFQAIANGRIGTELAETILAAHMIGMFFSGASP